MNVSDAGQYSEAWRAYNRMWWKSLGLTVLWFVGAGVTPALIEFLVPSAPPWVVVAVAALCFVGAIVVSQPPIRWPCPRCGRPFHATFWWHNGFARRCVHCRLPKWAARNPDAE